MAHLVLGLGGRVMAFFDWQLLYQCCFVWLATRPRTAQPYRQYAYRVGDQRRESWIADGTTGCPLVP
ncbi:hypothetical protein GCM10010413_12850 [Promicromonospora sukumoe]